MSENKHTPEPWHIAKHNKSIIKCYQGEQTPHGTTPYFAGGGALESEREANARRIVACVNACAGLENDQLEKVVKNPLSSYRELMRERDELFAKLDRMEGRAVLAEAKRDEAQKAADFNFEQYQDVGRLLHEVCEQRDKLLEIAVELLDGPQCGSDQSAMIRNARAVIGSVKGEAK